MALSKKEWIRQCQDLFVSEGGLSQSHALELAEWCWTNRSKGQTPEAAVDEDMKHWDV